MRTTIVKLRDHNFFTNTCCECRRDFEDHCMIPVYVTRISGLIPKEYFEPDYMCENCAIKVEPNLKELQKEI